MLLSKNEKATKPFVKWVGGKRWLVPHLLDVFPNSYERYFEPFLGGGATFFQLNPWPATLSDCNPELINSYLQVRDNVDEVISRLSAYSIDKATFLRIRSSQPRIPITKAVRFLYLNRTAFNGIYRVNRNGEFNVPFGCKPGTVLCDEVGLRKASSALRGRKIRLQDFQESVEESSKGDLLYVDPPYTVKHNLNGFRRYNEKMFSWSDQIRLAKCCRAAVNRGVFVVVSNANHKDILELYDDFKIKILERSSRLSASIEGRTMTDEALFISF